MHGAHGDPELGGGSRISADARAINPRATSVVAGALFVSGWAAAEGAFQGASVSDMTVRLGVVAPLALLMGLGAAVVREAWCWAKRSPAPFAQARARVLQWLGSRVADGGLRRVAWLSGGLISLSLWGAASIALGARALDTIRTPWMAAATVISAALALSLVAVLATPVWAAALHACLGALHRVAPSLTARLRPRSVLLAVAGAAGLALAGLWALHTEWMLLLPWSPVVAALCGGALATAATAIAGRRAYVAVVAVTLASAALWALLLPQPYRARRADLLGEPSVTGVWYATISSALRLDQAPPPASVQDGQRDEVLKRAQARAAAHSTGRVHHPVPVGVNRTPHVVLITTDSLSHDHTNLGAYPRTVTPHLRAWAERATTFTSAFSLSAATRTALPGLLAGMFNSQVAMKAARVAPFPYADQVVTLASVLKQRGYRTVHIPGGDYFLNPKERPFHAVGFDEVQRVIPQGASHTAPEVTRAALDTLTHHPPSTPLFLWVHYYDHHGPYEIPEGEVPFGTAEIDLYDTELRYADRHWGRLMERVEATWNKEDYVLIFTSDHGESFDANHVKHHHSRSVLTSVLHVPFVVQASRGRGRRVDGLVSHADVLPTLANLIGHPAEPDWVGESLIPVLFEDRPVEKTVLYSLRYAPERRRRGEDGFFDIGVRTARHYLMFAVRKRSFRLVDWRNDLLERTDLSDQLPEEYETLRALALDKLAWLRSKEAALKPQ